MNRELVVLVCGLLLVSMNVSASDVEFLREAKVFPESLPISEAVRVGDIVYLSGQIGIKPGTLNLVAGGIQAEARQTLENIRLSLESYDLTMKDIVKCTVMLADISDWPMFNEIYESAFSHPYPARSAFGTSGLALNSRVELECMAVITD